MKKFIVMLTCETSHESPWFVTRGTEQCAKVRGLSDEDSIVLTAQNDDGSFKIMELERGVNPIKELGKRFKLSKDSVAKPPVPTTIEIYFG